MKMYIAVLDEFPDHMTPTLVAHAVLGAHLQFIRGQTDLNKLMDEGPLKHPQYIDWFKTSFKKLLCELFKRSLIRVRHYLTFILVMKTTRLTDARVVL